MGSKKQCSTVDWFSVCSALSSCSRQFFCCLLALHWLRNGFYVFMERASRKWLVNEVGTHSICYAKFTFWVWKRQTIRFILLNICRTFPFICP